MIAMPAISSISPATMFQPRDSDRGADQQDADDRGAPQAARPSRQSRAELGRIHVLDANLAQSLRALVVSEPKLEDAVPSVELHVAIGVDAKARNERASAELAFWSMHSRYACPMARSERGTLTALSDASSPVRPRKAE